MTDTDPDTSDPIHVMLSGGASIASNGANPYAPIRVIMHVEFMCVTLDSECALPNTVAVQLVSFKVNGSLLPPCDSK